MCSSALYIPIPDFGGETKKRRALPRNARFFVVSFLDSKLEKINEIFRSMR